MSCLVSPPHGTLDMRVEYYPQEVGLALESIGLPYRIKGRASASQSSTLERSADLAMRRARPLVCCPPFAVKIFPFLDRILFNCQVLLHILHDQICTRDRTNHNSGTPALRFQLAPRWSAATPPLMQHPVRKRRLHSHDSLASHCAAGVRGGAAVRLISECWLTVLLECCEHFLSTRRSARAYRRRSPPQTRC